MRTNPQGLTISKTQKQGMVKPSVGVGNLLIEELERMERQKSSEWKSNRRQAG